jgi:hypothetical protein
MKINELIEAYTSTQVVDGDTAIYYGRIGLQEMVNNLPEGFSDVPGWADGYYRRTFISDKHLAEATYCEGDFSLLVAKTEAAYKAAIQESHQVYVVQRGGIYGYTDISPEGQPIAASAIEDIPGIDDQPWRHCQVFNGQDRFFSYENAIISDPDPAVVLGKTAKLMLQTEVEHYSRGMYYYRKGPSGSGQYFDQNNFYGLLMSEIREYFADINEPNTHIELKNWVWQYFSSRYRPGYAPAWLQAYKEREDKGAENDKQVEDYSSVFLYLFDAWKLKEEGAIKVKTPYRVQVTYTIGKEPLHYQGQVVAYRHIDDRKQFIIQPDDNCFESCGYLVYWLERDRLQLI